MAAITIRELLVKLGVKADTASLLKFDAALNIATKTMQAASFVTRKLTDATIGLAIATAKQGDEAAKAGQRVGISAQEMQKLGFAAQQSGAELIDVETAFRRQARAAVDAAKGTGRAAETYRDLGIKVKDATGKLKEPLPLFLESANAIKKLGTETEKASAANDLFGRGGAKILPLLNLGAEGINKMREQAVDLGFVLDEKATKASEEFIDRANELRLVLVGLRNQIGVRLIPVLTSLINGFQDFITTNRRFIRQRIDRFMVRVEKAVDFLRRGFVRVDEAVRERLGGWPVLFEQIEKVGKFTATTAGLAAVIKLVRAAQLALLALFAPGAPVLIGIGLLVAAFIGAALVIEDFLVFLKGGRSVVGQFLESFGQADQIRERLLLISESFGRLRETGGRAFEALSKVLALFGIDLSAIGDLINNQVLNKILSVDKALEGTVIAIDLVNSALDTWVSRFETLVDLARRLANFVEEPARALASGIGGVAQAGAGRVSQGQFVPRAVTAVPAAVANPGAFALGAAAQTGVGEALIGGITRGLRSAGITGAPITQQNTIQVTASPGMNEETLAAEIVRQQEMLMRQALESSRGGAV